MSLSIQCSFRNKRCFSVPTNSRPRVPWKAGTFQPPFQIVPRDMKKADFSIRLSSPNFPLSVLESNSWRKRARKGPNLSSIPFEWVSGWVKKWLVGKKVDVLRSISGTTWYGKVCSRFQNTCLSVSICWSVLFSFMIVESMGGLVSYKYSPLGGELRFIRNPQRPMVQRVRWNSKLSNWLESVLKCPRKNGLVDFKVRRIDL